MPRAVFLARDNTLVATEGYLGDPAEVKLITGAAAAMASLRGLGYLIIMVTNQGGVARGLFDEAAVQAVNAEIVRQLHQQAGAAIDRIYYCPFHPEAKLPQYRKDHEWRKPRPGMLQAAAKDFSLDLAQCWMVGDQPTDITAGAAVGCRTILLRHLDHPELPPALEKADLRPDFVARTLADAARIILREKNLPIAPRLRAKTSDVSAPAVMESAWAAAPPLESEISNFKSALASAAAESAFVAAPPLESGISNFKSAAAAVQSETANPLAQSPPPSPEPKRSAPPLASPAGRDSTRRTLEEILLHLRQLNRHHHLPEFSLAMLLAAMAQMIVVLFLALAAWDALAAQKISPVLNPHNWWYLSTSQRLDAISWLVAALVLQVLVVALHLVHRNP